MKRREFLLGAMALGSCAGMEANRKRPILIAHRGASGERPEHTRAAYRLAISQGADFIEPDLVMTKDGTLVCRHENDISETTDIATRPEFASRRASKVIDGATIEGWFTEDFTLAELKTLRCKERLPQLRPANMAFDGQEPILTFAEALAIAKAGRVGIYPELKHPSYFVAAGLDPVPLFIAELDAAGMNTRGAPVYAQCFERGALERLMDRSPVKRVQLMSGEGGPFDRPGVSYVQMIANVNDLASYADALGVEKNMVLPRAADDALGVPASLVARAHEARLAVHVWTFRAENYFLPRELKIGADPRAYGNLAREITLFVEQGVDGLFCDFPAFARAALDEGA